MRLSACRGKRAQSPGQREIYQYQPTLPMPYPCIVVSTWHSPISTRSVSSPHRRAMPPVFTLQLFFYGGYCRGIKLLCLILAQSGLGSRLPPHAPVRPAPYTSVARCTLVNVARASTTRQLVSRYSMSIR